MDSSGFYVINKSPQVSEMGFSDSSFYLNSPRPIHLNGNVTVSDTLTAYNMTSNVITGIGDLFLNSGYGGRIWLNSSNARDIQVGGSGSYVGFMGASPAAQQSAQRLAFGATSEQMRIKINGLIDKLSLLGLFYAYD